MALESAGGGPAELDHLPLRIGLRQLVLRLTKAELIVVHGWIRRQLVEAKRHPRTNLVRVPDDDDASDFDGEAFLTMASRVRMHVCELPPAYLIVMDTWITSRLTHAPSAGT